METIIVHPKSQKQLATIEAILKALDVSFKKEEKSPYNPDFVARILESKKQVEQGNYITLDPAKSLWENLL
ncbi:MAG TPA: DUF2683 family protein [Mucilaginibacter sp.]|jgi:hypothetical protein